MFSLWEHFNQYGNSDCRSLRMYVPSRWKPENIKSKWEFKEDYGTVPRCY
jgi:hypothetical protein